MLNTTQQPLLKVTSRSIRNHLNSLPSKFKIEEDENSAEAVRNRSRKRLSETKKRETIEPQTKQARKNHSETIQLTKEV